MHLRGIVQSAALVENPPGGEIIDMVLRIQGVGPGQPRLVVIPYALLLADEHLDPEAVSGRGFEADVEQTAERRWEVTRITFSSRILRPSE